MKIPVPDNGTPVQPGDDHFIYKDVYHPITWINDLPYRPRVETLVVKDGELVYARVKDKKSEYELPGGSTDIDSPSIVQAKNEVNEEALIDIKNIYDSGVQYYEDYPDGFIMGGGDTPLEYNGHISTVFVAEYSGIFDKRKVEEKDLDPKIADNGKFYRIVELVPMLKDEHISALLNCPYVKSHIKGSIRIIQRMNKPKTSIRDEFKKNDITGELFIASKNPNMVEVIPRKTAGKALHVDETCTKVRVFTSIDNALSGFDTSFIQLSNNDTVYIYAVDDDTVKLYTPTNDESPSAKLTGELWIKTNNPIKVKRLGLIRVMSDGSTDKYYYGKNSMFTGEIQKFSHKWITKDIVKSGVLENNFVVPDNKLYHGSTYEITEFKPMSLDLGNASEEPGWSTFCFTDYTMALRFALMRAIQKVKDYYGEKYKSVVCSWDIMEKKPWLTDGDYKRIHDSIMGFKFYVYTIDASNLDVGIGNDDRFPEYTFRESGIIPEKTDVLYIDEYMIRGHLHIIPSSEISAKIKAQETMAKYHHIRGWYATMMTRDYNNGSASAMLQKAVSRGDLVPGDDIRKYMDENGITFEDDSIKFGNTFNPTLESRGYKKTEMYFLSEKNMDGASLTPRIPINYMTKNGFEDNRTKRVCFAPSINQCLMAVSRKCKGERLYVHVPVSINPKDVIHPSTDQVPDSKITNEIWITSNVKIQCVGMIEVIGDAGKPGHEYTYGKHNEHTAELYDWDWKWVNKIESLEPVIEGFIFSKNNLYINYDSFKNGSSNVCLVTGLSGSGKTTLGSKIANDNKAELIELDMFEQCYVFENDEQLKECGQVFYDYLSSHKDIWAALKNKSIRGKDLSVEIDKFLKYCISWCKRDKKNKYVLEGVQIYSFLSKSDLGNMPIIFVGTSALKSLIRRLKRAKSNSKDDFKREMSELPQCIAWYITEEKTYKAFKKAVLESSIDDSDVVVLGEPTPALESCICESEDASKLVKNFKTKDAKDNFKFISLSNPISDKYLSQTHSKKDIENIHKTRSGEIVINTEDDKLAGYCFVFKNAEWKGYISPLVVVKKYRGYGLSNTLIEHVIRKYGGNKLFVTKDNEVAINLYKKHGFKVIQKDENGEPTASPEYFFMLLESLSLMESTSEVFGLPELRKYPLNNESDVLSAIKFFNFVEPKYEEELVINLKRRLTELGMGKPPVTSQNRFAKYVVDIGTEFNKTGNPANWSITGTISDTDRHDVLRKSSRFAGQPTYHTSSVYVNGNEEVGIINVFRDINSRNIAHAFIVIDEPYVNENFGDTLLDELILALTDGHCDIDYIKIDYSNGKLSDEYMTAFTTNSPINVSQLRNSNPVTESWIPVMEAPAEEDDDLTPTDYTADDSTEPSNNGENDDTPSDYTEEVPEDETPEDESEPTEPEEGSEENTGEDDLEGPTDYTEETPDDTAGETDGETSEPTDNAPQTGNGNLFDNNVLKNYSLLRNFEKLYEMTKEVSDSLDSTVMPTKLQNTVLTQVLRNLDSIKEFILSYVKFQFSEDNYSQNLYYYNIVIQSLKLNLELLKRNKQLEEKKK